MSDVNLTKHSVRAQREGRYDVNDVSFLFPRGEGLLPLDAFINEALFKNAVRLVDSSAADEAEGKHMGDWHIVSARADLCARARTTDPCHFELRLVAQPDMRDSALHLIYATASLSDDLIALAALAGDATLDQPLGVHPVLRKEGANGPYGTALKALITKHATRAQLGRIAAMIEIAHGQFCALRMGQHQRDRRARLFANRCCQRCCDSVVHHHGPVRHLSRRHG